MNDFKEELQKNEELFRKLAGEVEELRKDALEHAKTKARIIELEAGIRNHRDQRGDDRCWLDDKKLYELVGGAANTALPDEVQFLSNCARYHASRQDPRDKYVTVEEERLKAVVDFSEMVKTHHDKTVMEAVRLTLEDWKEGERY